MKKKKLWVRLLAALLAAAVLLTGLMIWKNKKTKAAAAARAQSLNTAAVEKRTITSELSSSGTLAAKDTYSITSMVEGEVVAAAFEEGDQVQKDQVLYEIDSSSIDVYKRQPFDTEDANVFLNGVESTLAAVKASQQQSGFAVLYYNCLLYTSETNLWASRRQFRLLRRSGTPSFMQPASI